MSDVKVSRAGGLLGTEEGKTFSWDKVRQVANPEIIIAFTLFTVLMIIAVFGAFLQTHDPMQGDLLKRFTPPGQEGYFFGSDHLGRDLWSRMVDGLQWSMACALTANVINLLIGSTLGLLAAEKPGPLRIIGNQFV